MANFLVVIPANNAPCRAETLFRAGLELTQEVKGQRPRKVVTAEWSRAASFPRRNGSGGPLVCDEETGSWLLTSGTWFHTDGYAAGEEGRLLQRYRQVGAERLAQELEGFFVVVLGDGRTRETVVLTDILGSCHCFIRTWKDALALSGSSFVLAGMDECTLDPIGCQEFLGCGVIYEDRTIYREVRKLGPASVYRFANGTISETRRYWRITDVEPESLDGKVAVHALGSAVTQAAQKVAKVFPRPVCDLTGGYDSRALVAMFRTAGVRFSTVVAGPAASADVRIAQQLAQVADLPHLHLPPVEPMTLSRVKEAFALTDGEFDLVEYARILDIHERLAKSFDISLNGSFGEVARGYWWELLFPRVGARGKLDSQKLSQMRYAAQPYDDALFPREGRLDLVAHLAAVIERTNAGLADLPNTVQMNSAYLLMRMQRWQGRIGSSTNQVWPCLPPFLFRSVLEVMLRAKARLCRRGLLVRRLLAEFQPALAAVPLEHGNPALPFTLGNAHRFLPLIRLYAVKTARKCLTKIGVQRSGSLSSAGSVSPRQQLWQDEEVRALLQPVTMQLGGLADSAGLIDFLRRAQEPRFHYDAQWARVLSLEITLQKLAEVQRRWRAGGASFLSGGRQPPENATAQGADAPRSEELCPPFAGQIN